jgi:hypothetical protein
VRILLLLALAVAGRAETIRYYLHDATIGDDPRHAVNAAVSGIFDYDTSLGRITLAAIGFHDNGFGTLYSSDPAPSDLAFRESVGQTASNVPSMNTLTEPSLYEWPRAWIYFTQPLGPQTVATSIDLSRSFVQLGECTQATPGPGGCSNTRQIFLDFHSGFVSTSQTTPRTLGAQFGLMDLDAPVANPEPSTLLLSATCGCLFAWRMRRTHRRLS